MDYLLLFLEGIVTFISPCLLPMIPIYIMYFAGGAQGAKGKTLGRALAFVLGFTTVFVALGAFAGLLGGLLVRYQKVVNIVAGAIVIVFGLNYLGLFEKLFGRNLFGEGAMGKGVKIKGVFSAYVFGLVFSISWTPCVGPFLGTALAVASVKGGALPGVLMLLCYSAGLAIPFILSAVLINRLEAGFNFIKHHYTAINRVAGALLVVVGVLIATGLLGRWLAMLSF